jgi:FAD/FMN-containing dehydrogenase
MSDINIKKEIYQSFKNNFHGSVISPGDAAYDEARRVWNGMIDRRPAMIARCSNVADVAESIQFGRDNDLLVSIRGGGHNVAGYAVCDDGLVIDMSAMRKVEINPDKRTVRVEGGAVWGDVDPVTQEFGLATPGGEVSLTGVAGLTLGGGVGYLRRKYGLSCDNLQSVDIVTAEGQLLTADAEHNSDLFWALRGGGGNFGVVMSFEFRLHPVGPEIVTVNPIFPVSEARTQLKTWRKFADAAPDEASTAFAIWGIPEHPALPNEFHGMPVCMFDGMYVGPPEEGEALFRPLREAGSPVLDLSDRKSYTEAQTGFDDFMLDGDLYYWKSLFLNEISDDVINALLSWVKRRPNPRILVIIRHMGGAVSRVDGQATAYQNRDSQFMLSIDGTWTDPAESERNIAWIRGFWEAMRRFSNGGVYINFPGFGENAQSLWQASYGGNYEQLVAVKTKYDPTNFFRMNQNIRPVDKSWKRIAGTAYQNRPVHFHEA